MKKALIYLLLLITFQAKAQTNPITSINISLPSNPDANTANWGTGVSQLTITASGGAVNGRVNGFVVESKILVIIKKNGTKICGAYTSGTAPSSNFNTLTKVWSGSNAVSLLGQSCILPPGDYELSVQFFNYSNGKLNPLSDEKTKAFTIRGSEQPTYQAPQLIAPANETRIKESDLLKPITFRWTPVIPRPQEVVTYRLRVWQLMEGQNGTQARTVNQPITTKDVDNLTQATISNPITGPCKPPYLCDFVWNVQALNREGKPIGTNSGTSENFTFSFSSTDKKPPMITLVSPTNGSILAVSEMPTFRWKITVNPVNDPPTVSLKIVEIIGDQSPEQAYRSNKPHFEKDSLKEIFYYPSTAPALKSGKKYAWAVGSAPPSMFQMASCDVNLSLKLRSVECLPDVDRNKRYKINFSSTYISSTYNLTYTQAGSGLTAYHPSYSPNYSITNISPALLPQNSGASTTVNYSLEVSVPIGQTAIKVGLQGDDKDPGPITCKPGAELDVNLPVCTVPTCDCGKWGSLGVRAIVATATNAAIPYRSYKCEDRISWKCNAVLSFSTTYTCLNTSVDCAAKTSWEIKKDGVVIKTGSGINAASDIFMPTSNGIYTLTLNANCDGKECLPCTFTIVVEDCKPIIDCDCGKWGPLVYEGNKYECGSRIKGSCKKPFQFTSSYQCKTLDKECVANTTWEVRKGDLLIKSGTGTNTLSDGLSLVANGIYTLTLNANCGDKKCQPCVYTIVVDDCINTQVCDCGTWGLLNIKPVHVSSSTSVVPLRLNGLVCGTKLDWKCNQVLSFSNIYKCSTTDANCVLKTSWEIKKDGVLIKTGNGLNNVADTFKPTENGTYTLTLNANCGGKDCLPCIYNFVVKDCKPADPCETKTWSALGTGMNGVVYALIEMGGNLYAGGDFTTAGGVTVNNIAKWDGTSWAPLQTGTNRIVRALAVIGGNLYAAGDFTTASGIAVNRIAKWNGTSWSTLGSGVSGPVFALSVMGGDLFASGQFNIAGGVGANNIAKWNGTSWLALGSGISGTVSALAVMGSNLFAAGWFSSAGGVSVNNIAKWNGTSWSVLGSGTNNYLYSLVVFGTDLYAGGTFYMAGGTNTSNIAKWNGTNWSALGSGVNSIVTALASSGNDLYVGGDFSTAGSLNVNRMGKWNGSSWALIGNGVNSDYVRSFAWIGTDLYVGGGFTAAGGISANRIVKYGCNIPPIVGTETACNCVEKPWDVVQKIVYNDGSKTVGQEIKCLEKVDRKIKTGSKITYYAPAYSCNKQDCKATYSWKIVELSKGTVYSSGTTTSFPIDITAPTVGGDYKFEVTPSCGSTTCKPCGFTFMAAPCFKIGDKYEGGIIFYIDESCEHGLIAATDDQSPAKALFNTNWTFSNGASMTSTDVGTGNGNTSVVYNVDLLGLYPFIWTFSIYSAPQVCRDLVLNGYSDWYLPSKDELNLMYQQRNVIGSFSTGEYWSSSFYWLTLSDNPYRFGWFQKFDNGNQGHVDFHLAKRVRAIRSF